MQLLHDVPISHYRYCRIVEKENDVCGLLSSLLCDVLSFNVINCMIHNDLYHRGKLISAAPYWVILAHPNTPPSLLTTPIMLLLLLRSNWIIKCLALRVTTVRGGHLRILANPTILCCQWKTIRSARGGSETLLL